MRRTWCGGWGGRGEGLDIALLAALSKVYEKNLGWLGGVMGVGVLNALTN